MVCHVEDKFGKEVNNLYLCCYKFCDLLFAFALCIYLSFPLRSSCHKETIVLGNKKWIEGWGAMTQQDLFTIWVQLGW
jgi:hypothetical protein